MSMFGGNSYNSGSSTFSGSQVGGGFMNNTQNNKYGNENYNTSNIGGGSGGQKANVPYDQRKLSQITIKQIITAPPPQPDSNLVIDGVDITQVSMIAQIKSIDLQSSHTTLTINDLTGSLQAKKWANDNQAPDQSTNLVEGQWVRIYGRINHYGGRCSINIYEIIPITNHDDITHHFLECIYAHLYNTSGHLTKTGGNYGDNNGVNKGSNYGGNSNQFMGNNGNGNYNNNNNMGNNGMQIDNNNGGGWGNHGGAINNNLSPVENKVLNIIKAPQYENSDAGCNIDSVFQQLSNEDVNAIRSAIDTLSDAGYIYSTVDEEHYKFAGDQQ